MYSAANASSDWNFVLIYCWIISEKNPRLSYISTYSFTIHIHHLSHTMSFNHNLCTRLAAESVSSASQWKGLSYMNKWLSYMFLIFVMVYLSKIIIHENMCECLNIMYASYMFSYFEETCMIIMYDQNVHTWSDTFSCTIKHIFVYGRIYFHVWSDIF